MSRPAWEMTIPVISTVHVQGPAALNDAIEHLVRLLPYEQGWFVQINDEITDGEPHYITALRHWFKNEISPIEPVWIRIDADGDAVEGLPTFDAEWEALQAQAGAPNDPPPGMKFVDLATVNDDTLDWLVAKCLGETLSGTLDPLTWRHTAKPSGAWDFCSNPVLSQAIIDKEGIECIAPHDDIGELWEALDPLFPYDEQYDANRGKAAMKVFVALKHGTDKLLVPADL